MSQFSPWEEDTKLDLIYMESQDVIESLTLEAVEKFLISLGAGVDVFKDHLEISTICHNMIESNPSHKLYYYQNTHMFICYTCCGAMNIFTLYKNYMEINHEAITYGEAIEQVKSFIELHADISVKTQSKGDILFERYRDKHNIRKCEAYDEKVLDLFTNYYHPTWRAEGITVEAMEHFEIMFNLGKNQIIIPQRDLWGDLVGIRRRALEEEDLAEAKYKPIKIGNISYSCQTGNTLYGIYQHQDAIRKYRRAIIYESEKSVLQDESFYGEDSVGVAIFGSNLTRFHVALLVEILGVNEIVLALDKEFVNPYDEKGKRYRHKLIDIAKKYNTFCEFSYIFDEQNLLQEKDSPTDRGQETFEKLFRKRIKVR